MLEATDRASVIMMTGYVMRFTHPFQVLYELFAAGELGRLVNCWTRRYMPFDTSKLWYGDQAKSGGVALDFASHDIDWVRWVGGDVRRVFGRVDRVRPGIRADEHVHALFTFAEGRGSSDDSWVPGLGHSSIGLVGSSEAAIVSEDGTELPVGERGELQVRGTSVIRGYWNRPGRAPGPVTRPSGGSPWPPTSTLP